QDDAEVYDALQHADTVGLFQVESRAQMASLPRLRPMNFYDIVVQVAIIRPGPIVGNMVHPYIRRRQGREVPDYMDPSLEPVLKRTLGVPLFQEQLLRMAMICAGFTGGEAEELRRAMGFKRSELRMKEIEKKLRLGMTRNGIAPSAQDAIVNSITSFALYGFPESHAASFALLAYASAYLKCHYLAAFTAALLNNQPMGFYHPFTIIKDAQRKGLKVLPIDITRSDWGCSVEIENISPTEAKPEMMCLRLGLNYVKGLREEAGRAIIREREKRPFSSIEDLSVRVPEVRKDELRKLARIGALNFISPDENGGRQPHHASRTAHRESDRQYLHRRDALWQAERASRPAGPLVKSQEESDARSPLLKMTVAERINADLRTTSLTIGKHPMAYRRRELNKLGALRATDLPRVRNGAPVRVAGWVICRQRPGTAKGFLFLSLEDETGIMNAIITPDVYDRNRLVVVSEDLLLIDGVIQNQDGVIHVKANRIRPLESEHPRVKSHDFR
ncbi:MAG TPA: OB-fold nucleic acid binding domain-containing protein, partial [Blastocatellia bacterium]|nr:OB-fold nucleic acid binding domain-containing protein [Blastocatellia bacterium]